MEITAKEVLEKHSDKLEQGDIIKAMKEYADEVKYELVREALGRITETFKKRGWTKESKELHSDICCDIINAKCNIE